MNQTGTDKQQYNINKYFQGKRLIFIYIFLHVDVSGK